MLAWLGHRVRRAHLQGTRGCNAQAIICFLTAGAMFLVAMLRDTLAALEQLPQARLRFRKNLPSRTHPGLAKLELDIRNRLKPAEAYNTVPGR